MGFESAYDTVLAKWPAGVEPLDVPTPFGTTRVHAYGPAGREPLVLIHGGGATSTVWYAVVPALSAHHRVYAPDRIDDAGRGVPGGRRVTRAEDLIEWLDALRTGLGAPTVGLCGHSYGGWLALRYALSAPDRVSRLGLLDPTDCFTGPRLSYRLQAVPLFLRPSPARVRAFIEWEAGGAPVDPDWLELAAAGTVPKPAVLPRRPSVPVLRGLRVPTLIVLAGRSRAHDVRRVADRVRRTVPDARVHVVPDATHYTLPLRPIPELAGFFGR
jgi:pimeloyl-ACP methyl ester carboxylesterase